MFGFRVLVLIPDLRGTGGIQRYGRAVSAAIADIVGSEAVRVLALETDQSVPNRWRTEAERLSAWAKARYGLRLLADFVRFRPDVVICLHVALAPLAAAISRVGGVPFLVVGYGLEVWGKMPLSKLTALREAERIVTISGFTARRLEVHGIEAGRISIIPPCLEPEWLQVLRQEDSSESVGPLVLSVGRLSAHERYKGFDLVLRSMTLVREHVPQARYVIVGGGPDKERLRRLASELGLDDAVEFRGALPDTDVAHLYRSCSLLAMPSRTVLDDDPKGEGFGIAFLEAMACGKPVIGPRTGAPAEFITHEGEGLLVDAEDPVAIGEAILRLLTEPELAASCGHRGRRLVEDRFGYRAFRAAWASLLTQIVSVTVVASEASNREAAE